MQIGVVDKSATTEIIVDVQTMTPICMRSARFAGAIKVVLKVSFTHCQTPTASAWQKKSLSLLTHSSGEPATLILLVRHISYSTKVKDHLRLHTYFSSWGHGCIMPNSIRILAFKA